MRMVWMSRVGDRFEQFVEAGDATAILERPVPLATDVAWIFATDVAWIGDALARELAPLPFHPIDEIIDQGRDVLAARCHASCRRQTIDRAFQREDGIELPNHLESDRRNRGRLLLARFRSDVGKLE